MNIEPIPASEAWELEYKNSQLLTKDMRPTKEFRDFVAWLEKEESYDFTGKRVLDLGCGTGRNILYLAKRHAISGLGIDISPTAIQKFQEAADALQLAGANIGVTARVQDLSSGGVIPGQVDVVIDSTTTHLLAPTQRRRLIEEMASIMSPGSHIYVRTLTKDGDRNAHNLMKHMPGPDPDSYIHPQLGVVEYVPTVEDIVGLYDPFFQIAYRKKYTGYQRWGKQSYKRRYLVLYLRKK